MASSGWISVASLLIYSCLFTTAAEAASISLSWADMSNNEEGFRIERMASGGSYAQIATVGANVQAYTDSTVTAGASYCYVVKAYNSAGISAPSSSACVTASSTTGSGTGSAGSGTGSTGSTTGSGGSTGSTGGTGTTPSSYVGSKWKDYTVRLSMKSLDDDTIGVIFRYLDDGNYYRFVWNRAGGYQRIEKRQDGVLSLLAKNSNAYKKSKAYLVQITVRGSQIEVKVNGATSLTANDNSIDQGTIALYSSANAGSVFDDVVVTDLTSGQTLLSENFNDGNHTGWTILDDAGTSASAWAVSNGALSQTSNSGSSENSLGTFALYTKGSWTNYTASVTLASTDDDFIGVMFRYQDNVNYYRFSWKTDNSIRKLETIRGGVATVIAQDSQPYIMGRTYAVQISAKDNSLQVHIDGQQIFSVTDSSFASGTIALYSCYNSGSSYNNVLVEDLNDRKLLLWEDFHRNDLRGWTVMDEGSKDGPSQWLVTNGTLVQNSNIGSGTGHGTYVLY